MKGKKTKENRIQEEKERLDAVYENISDKKKKVINGLIERAAYMRVTLEDYEKDLDDNGYVEQFSHSEKTEPYER